MLTAKHRLQPSGEGWVHADDPLHVTARCQVLDAIRSEVERFDPAELGDLHAAREMIVLAGTTAQSAFTQGSQSPEWAAAAAAERKAFIEFVRSLTPAELASVVALPYRRVLASAETRERFDALARVWGNWYGGSADRHDLPPYSLLQASRLNDDRLRFVRELIRGHVGASRVWELREWGDSFELDLELVHLDYTGAEGFWTCPPLDWLVYASHEDSLTVGGTWLRDALRAQWPDWHDLLYRNYHGNDAPWTD